MRIPGPRPSWPRRLRLPRPTARLRLTILYGGVFLACGAAVLALTYLLDGHATRLASLHGYSPPSASTPPKVAPAGPVAAEQARVHELKAELLSQIASDRHQLLIQSGIALTVVAFLALVIGWFIAGRVLRPLSTITAAARQISASKLHERLALQGPDDELKELGDTLDHLFARLEASFEGQRQFAANASHELRTPLTRERALIEVTRADPASTTDTWRAVSEDLLAFNAEQDRLIEALLTLASSDAVPAQPERTDLAAIASAAMVVPRTGISRLGLNVQASLRPAILDGDPLLLQRLLANLIDNAVQHNVPSGDVRVATGTRDGQAVLSVANSGPVIPPAEIDRLFQPFQRLGLRTARGDGGHGLGLSIVRAIAEAHGATTTARSRPEGGLVIEVAFPSVPVSLPQIARRSRAESAALVT
jgi:signal transduction histidine kinase